MISKKQSTNWRIPGWPPAALYVLSPWPYAFCCVIIYLKPLSGKNGKLPARIEKYRARQAHQKCQYITSLAEYCIFAAAAKINGYKHRSYRKIRPHAKVDSCQTDQLSE
jgi:hypothetical protein